MGGDNQEQYTGILPEKSHPEYYVLLGLFHEAFQEHFTAIDRRYDSCSAFRTVTEGELSNLQDENSFKVPSA
jgi:hypothetical protein